MPTLTLSADAITNPSLEQIRRVQAVMLWPNDEAMREQACALWQVEDLSKEAYDRGVSDAAELTVPLWLLKSLAASPSAKEVDRDIAKRKKLALAAGEHMFLHFSIVNGSGKIITVSGTIVPIVAGVQGMSEAWVNNKAWKPFRDVSHLWAAYRVEMCLEKSDFCPSTFANFPRFLALATQIRTWAVNHQAVCKPLGFIDEGEAWEILGPLPEGANEKALDALRTYWRPEN
jgi:hypothetical protein